VPEKNTRQDVWNGGAPGACSEIRHALLAAKAPCAMLDLSYMIGLSSGDMSCQGLGESTRIVSLSSKADNPAVVAQVALSLIF
jgi:hypothetical protein